MRRKTEKSLVSLIAPETENMCIVYSTAFRGFVKGDFVGLRLSEVPCSLPLSDWTEQNGECLAHGPSKNRTANRLCHLTLHSPNPKVTWLARLVRSLLTSDSMKEPDKNVSPVTSLIYTPSLVSLESLNLLSGFPVL